MSCPDWRRLLAARDRAEGVTEPAWRSAVEHLGGCPSCRATAFELDPSLLFVAQSPIEVSDDEIGTIQANVRVLRRARAQERAALEPRRRMARIASAAAVISLMVLLPTHTSRQSTILPVVAGPSLTLQRAPFAGGLAFEDSSAPLIEPYDLPLARIYQLGEDDLSVVMVVDESIDV
jgi:hypothetical protein